MKQTQQITLGEIENGMKVWNQGHLFEVRNLRKIDSKTCLNGLTYNGQPSSNDNLLTRPENHTIIRYEGHCVNAEDDIKGTVYDGGVYGGFSWVPASIQIEQ